MTGRAAALHGLDLTGATPFALLHRPGAADPHTVELLTGHVAALRDLRELPTGTTDPPAGTRHEVLALLPFRQITERGFSCHDDGEPLLALRIAAAHAIPLDDVLGWLPAEPVSTVDGSFDLADDQYAELAERIIATEIGRGAGANFVLRRSFTGTLDGYSLRTALSVFRRLLLGERGSYWTFLVHTGDRTFVGASPERHVSVLGDEVTMNPISGTYRYPVHGPDTGGLLRFLADAKETDELYMVLDEELKMMASVCEPGVRVHGPFLKEMSCLAHTEYLVRGRSTADVRDILRATMFAPTVTGSPVQNACRVIRRYERDGRGYYAGALALIGTRDGRRAVDAPIMIRTVDIDPHGRFRLSAGATLVRHSDPVAEAAETRGKARSLLAALGAERAPATGRAAPGGLAADPAVRARLAERNTGLAGFWLHPAAARTATPAVSRVLVVDGEDAFTAMLAHLLRAVATDVRVLPYDAPVRPAVGDVVVVGPGPGDPGDRTDPRIAALHALTERLLASGTPLLSICLGHQILATALGLPVRRKARPNQGMRRTIELFGTAQRVGFYNSFAAVHDRDTWHSAQAGDVRLCRDRETGEIEAMRGHRFASLQFHPESVLTEHGPDIVRDVLARVASAGATRLAG